MSNSNLPKYSRRRNIGDHGPVRDPYLSDFSEKHDLDSGCSVEPTLLLHLAVVLATDTWPHNNWCQERVSNPYTSVEKFTGFGPGVRSKPTSPPPPVSPKLRASEILFSTRNMANQDELGHVGSSVVLEEPMVQDNTVQDAATQVDHPPQPDPEVLMGAVGAAAQERPLRQIFPPVRGESASSGQSDFDRIMEGMKLLMQNMENRMDANARRTDANIQDLDRKMDEGMGEMQCMGLSLQAGQEAMRVDLDEVKGEMRTMDCIMVAPCGGATKPTRGSVECVRPAMEMGEVGMTSDATTIDGEMCRTRHEGTTEKLKEVMEKFTDRDAENKGDKGGNSRDAGDKTSRE